MKYELAKELKEAGFPVNRDKLWVKYYNGDWEVMLQVVHQEFGPFSGADEETPTPTLSELIEACPDIKEYHSEKCDFTLRFIGKEWVAGYTENMGYDGDYLHEGGSGSTPEEAVARLWLALNTNENTVK